MSSNRPHREHLKTPPILLHAHILFEDYSTVSLTHTYEHPAGTEHRQKEDLVFAPDPSDAERILRVMFSTSSPKLVLLTAFTSTMAHITHTCPASWAAVFVPPGTAFATTSLTLTGPMPTGTAIFGSSLVRFSPAMLPSFRPITSRRQRNPLT